MSGAEGTNNGWNLVDADQVTRVYVGDDTDGCTFLSGDVAVLFGWFFDQVHQHVERVYMLNGWRSRSYNQGVNGDDGSNHLSGTAGDVNGDRHPYEPNVSGTWSSGWTPTQQTVIRQIMAQTGGLISWGLDYNPGWRDAMHFDITKGRTPAQVRAFVATLTPPPSPEDDDMKDLIANYYGTSTLFVVSHDLTTKRHLHSTAEVTVLKTAGAIELGHDALTAQTMDRAAWTPCHDVYTGAAL